jgi:predicted nucleic acid-binding protein
MTIFLDSDVILDVLTKRKNFYMDSSKVLSTAREKKYVLITSTLAIANIHYIIQKAHDYRVAHESVLRLLRIVECRSTECSAIRSALDYGIKNDFEDQVQIKTALVNSADCIITRNLEDYKNASLPIYSPEQFLSTI